MTRTIATTILAAVALAAPRAARAEDGEERDLWFPHRVSLSQGLGLGSAAVITAASTGRAGFAGIWATLAYDYRVAGPVSVGLASRVGALEDLSAVPVDVDVIARVRARGPGPPPSAWLLGIGAGATRAFTSEPPARRAFGTTVEAGWGYHVSAGVGLEVVGRSGWGVVIEAAIHRHAFEQSWTYRLRDGGGTLSEDRNTVAYSMFGSLGVVKGF